MGKHSAKRTSLGPVRMAMLSMTALATAAVAAEHGSTEGAQQNQNRAVEATTSWTDLDSATGVLAKANADRLASTPVVAERVAAAPAVVAPMATEDTATKPGIPLTYDNPEQQTERTVTTVADTSSKPKSERLTGGYTGGKHAKKTDTVARKKSPAPAAPAAPDLGGLLTSIAQVVQAGAGAGGSLAQALGSGSSALGTGSASAAPIADMLSSGSGELLGMGSGSAIGGPLGQLAKALGSGSAALGTGSAGVSKASTGLISGFTPKSDVSKSSPKHAKPEPEEDSSSDSASDSGDTETAVG
ncbi:hypothetical protein [Nocardia sp. NPDC051570]|uniref:hypothetical protein n=1 Tax=Nocardia sp. NPDC051570 TaxID=3364324 RepID=UPI003797B12D